MSEPNTSDAGANQNTAFASLLNNIASLQFGALLVVATALTLGVGLIAWALQPDYVPVTGQSSREDALQVIDALNASQVNYKLDPSTGLVLVPKDQLAQIQLNLAASGLGSSDSSVGMELLQQDSSLGTSHFKEMARYQYAQETELSRTISSMRNVESARVHLAIPKQTVFVRDREQASASVMIKLQPGRSLEEEQVNAVINLVASSISYLESSQVTVVDQWGRLLSSGDDSASSASREQYQYARKLEKLYSEKIEALLTPIVGEGRVRAIVTADLDFTINEQTQENYSPDAAQIRSEQVDTQVNRDGSQAMGVPGALSNQPPGNGTVDPALPDQEAADSMQSESSSSVRNYELDRTITHVRQIPGNVQRISAAVIVDDRLEEGADGVPVRTPLTEAELAEYTRLAQEAIGYNDQRGDSVVVFNRTFKPMEEILPIEPLPMWQQDWLWNMVRQILIGLSVLLLVLFVLRPAVKRLVPLSVKDRESLSADNSAGGAKNALGVVESRSTPALKGGSSDILEPPSVIYGDILNMARAMAAEDPKRVAKVVKDWVSDQ